MRIKRSILMLEDDPDDRFITSTTMAEQGFNADLVFVKSSSEFIQFLEDNAKPDLILIDYNSSPLNGPQLLKYLKNDDRFQGIPVVVLGESSVERYIEECYASGASSYIMKPATLESTNEKIKAFFSYWLDTVEFNR